MRVRVVMRVRAVLLAAALALAPAGALAADLVVWWEKGFNPEEDASIKEIVAAFERKTGKRVELIQHSQSDMPAKALVAVEAGRPPDFLYGTEADDSFGRWAHEGRLVDLSDTLGSLMAQFDQDALEHATLPDATGRRGLHALPMALTTTHVHVWRSLLERAGFKLADIPKEWEAFWSFWCDQVQPAVRQATGRDDLWAVGLPMTIVGDTRYVLEQFMNAYDADYVTRDGRLVIDEPAVRVGLVGVLNGYIALHRKGCTPPDVLDWDNYSNNKAFLERRVVMTVNTSLSVMGALRATRREDYDKDAATIGWPETGAHGGPLAVRTEFNEAAVFRDGGHLATAQEFVRFLVGEGWLAHWLDFAGDRLLPPMPALLELPFWLDRSDPHRIASAMQFLTRRRTYAYDAASGDGHHRQVQAENVWPKAVHRVVADGLSPEQAVDEAIARVKQILSE